MSLWYSVNYQADPPVVQHPHSAQPLRLLDIKLNGKLSMGAIIPKKIAKSAEILGTETLSAVISSDFILAFSADCKIPHEWYVFFYC